MSYDAEAHAVHMLAVIQEGHERAATKPTFTRSELRELWKAVTQYIDNAALDDDTGEPLVSAAAFAAREKLDVYFGADDVAPGER